MATQFTHYASTDGSAPVISGTNGSLADALYACLVTGYGAKSGAGWTRVYSATGKAAFQQGAGSNGMFLRVQDDAPATAKEARCTGYVTMSDVDTGTGPFPTAAQGTGGVAMTVWRKSNTADSTARVWHIWADSRTVHVFIASGDSAGVYYRYSFGEFYSTVSSDSYRCLISGRTGENTNLFASERGGFLSATANSTCPGSFIARGHAGTGGSATVSVFGDYAKSSGTSMAGLIPYLNPADGGLYLSPIWISDTQNTPLYGIRGRLRGLWHFLHAYNSIADGDTVSGVGDLAGKTFYLLRNVSDQSGNPGVCVIETSNTVEAN